MSNGLRLMCVHAHPDDESSKGAATMARYVDAGVEVLVVSCTGGERGDVLNPQLVDDPHIQRDLAQVRRDEMAAAQAILGVQHTWLGFVDSGLPQGDPPPPLPQGCFALEPLEVTTEALVREIRRFRPHVVTTYDENGGYPHPDHIMTHRVTMAAVERAADSQAFCHAGAAWQVLKVYYNQTFSRERVEAFHQALTDLGQESPYADWLANWNRPERTTTTRVQCADWFDRRDAALLAHATQVDPDGMWFTVPREVQRRIWPTEEFECALSYVPVVDGEDDLFAALGTAQQADALAGREGLQPVYDGRAQADSAARVGA